MTCTKRVLWDNWGRYVTAFNVGDIVEVTVHESGTLSAESPYYKGVVDSVPPTHFEVTKQSLAAADTNENGAEPWETGRDEA